MLEGHREFISKAAFRQVARWLTAGLWVTGVALGCTASGAKLVESPLSVEQQQQEVLEVVPVGTSRDEAERRLQAAGIEYTRGGKGSIYYLALWNRQDGQRWHVNVALLFDRAGKLYRTRPGDSDFGLLSGKQSTQTAGKPAATVGDDGATPAASTTDEERVPFPGRSGSSTANR